MSARVKLGLTILFLAAVAGLGLVLLRRDSGDDGLHLADVPDPELKRAGIMLADAPGEDPVISESAARVLANNRACCGEIQQAALVFLSRRDYPNGGVLAWAIDFDTSTGPEFPPLGGAWRTSFTKSQPYFVLFLDANTGKHVYSLFPGTGYPFPDRQTSVTVEGLTASQLAESGLTLRAPAAPDFVDSAPGFEQIAAVSPYGSRISELFLVRVIDLDTGDRGETLAWLVNLGGVGPPPDYRVRVPLVFMDPETNGQLFVREVFVEE